MQYTPSQRKYLRGLAHELEPVVRIGKARVTPEVAAEADRALEAHELIKVRIDVEGRDARQALAEDLAERAGAALVTSIGKIAVLYRPREEKPKIKLP
ncbi:MAG TPA: ribosome assembly RNA-binding protein YhbY [Thermoanaerobaculia bacterium]